MLKVYEEMDSSLSCLLLVKESGVYLWNNRLCDKDWANFRRLIMIWYHGTSEENWNEEACEAAIEYCLENLI